MAESTSTRGQVRTQTSESVPQSTVVKVVVAPAGRLPLQFRSSPLPVLLSSKTPIV